MKSRIALPTPWRGIRIIASARSSEEDRRSAMNPGHAGHRLRVSLRGGQDGMSRRFMVAILSEIQGIHGNASRIGTDRLQSRVARWVRSGRLLAVPPPPLPFGSGLLPEIAEEAPPAPSTAEKVQDKTWIEIQILDLNDKPLSGHPYRLELPDGTIREGKVNADGLARVSGIDPGTCQLKWPRQRVDMYPLLEEESAQKTG